MGTVPPDVNLSEAAAQKFLGWFQQSHAAERGASVDTTTNLPPPKISQPATPDTEAPDTSGDGENVHKSQFPKPEWPKYLDSMTVKEILEHLDGVFPMDDVVVDSANLIPTLPNPRPY